MMKESGKSFLACHKKTKVSLLTAFLFLLISYMLCASAEAAVIYVDSNATGANNGTSWTDAYTDLQAALAAAVLNDQIWVAAGTYYPGAVRVSTFQLKNGVAVYGGFNGTETSLGQRDPATNVTILSGDIGIPGDPTDNCYHVVTGSGTGSTAILDGFTITGGYANGGLAIRRVGGGMVNFTGSPTLSNLIFTDNFATDTGGGMENASGSNPTLTNVTFSGNTAGSGGGMDNDGSDPTLTNVTFSGNTALLDGGGMYNTGSDSTLTNVTFSGNTAEGGFGGGIFSNGGSPTLAYVTFSGNIAVSSGGGIYNFGSNMTCNSCILWGDTGGEITGDATTVTYSIVQGGYPGTGNISSDPLLGTLGNNGGYTQTIPLLPGSAAINTIPVGTNGCGTTVTTDQRGVTRPEGIGCDMGAYEYVPPAVVPTMSEWGMIIFMILAGAGAVHYLGRRRKA